MTFNMRPQKTQFTGGVGKDIPASPSETILHAVGSSARKRLHVVHIYFQSNSGSSAVVRIRTGTLTVYVTVPSFGNCYVPVCVVTPSSGSTNILLQSTATGVTCTGFVEISA